MAAILNRGYDSTPEFLRFGRLQTVLAEKARYLKRIEPPPGVVSGYDRWRTISYEEYRRENPRAAPQMGIVEMFATRMEFGLGSYDDAAESSSGAETLKIETQQVTNPPAMLEKGQRRMHPRGPGKG